MTTPANTLIKDINTYLGNPTRLQHAVLDFTRAATNNEYQFVDPTNPVVMTIESAVMLSAATVTKYESILRKQYPILAQDYDDLFLHMSDMDYLNRFAVPAQTKFSVMFMKSEILNSMVMDHDKGYKKLVIPRNSYFTVADTRFCIEYPIEIRQLNYGGLHIVYNTDIHSPIHDLPTNIIEWHEVRGVNDETGDNIYIQLTFDVHQLKVESQYFDLNSSTKFSHDIPLEDQYYYTRVYIKDEFSNWKEIHTTHSDLVYDPYKTTAVLKVTDKCNVSIPEIYTTQASSSTKVRIDTYETKGPITMMLGNYPNSGFTATWRSLDEKEINEFVAPLETLKTQIVYSTSTVSGGKNGLTFEQMRDRLINNSIGIPKIPVSNVQIESSLEDQNYEIVKNIDNITNRTFLATRQLPKPSHSKLITAANASIQTGLFSIDEAVLVDTVIDNGQSITITPDTIYQNVNGKVTLLPSDVKKAILDLPIEQRAIYVNSKDLYYSPFHYVLDTNDSLLDARPYYLDDPKIEGSSFVGENDSTKLRVSTAGYRIFKDNYGYKVRVYTNSSDEYKALPDELVYIQLRFKPSKEVGYAYQNGTIIGKTEDGERIIEFDLSSTFEVDNEDNIKLTKFIIYTLDPKTLGSSLRNDFDIIYATSAVMDVQYRPNAVDSVLGLIILPPDIVGITHEILKIRFGHRLDRLWSRGRSIVSDASYGRYTTDLQKYYSEDIYEINPDTGGTIFIENGEPVQKLLHAKNDPVLVNGEPVYEHRKGDIITDSDGNPVIAKPRKLYRQVDYLLIEASYWFATDSIASAYRKEMTDIYVDWITNGLAQIQQKLIEQTSIYFYPKVTTGRIPIMVKNGIETTMSASQQFTLTLHVDSTVYNNLELREQLKIKTIEVINQELNKSVVSMSKITKELTNVYGVDVIDVEINGLGGKENYSTITIMNETDRPSIKKLLKAQNDGSLIVEEAVELLFVKHEIVGRSY